MGSRTQRLESARSRYRRVRVVAAVAVGLLIVAGIAFYLGSRDEASPPGAAAQAPHPEMTQALAAIPPTIPADVVAGPKVLVEVPNVTGKSLDEASLVMQYAGFVVVPDPSTASDEATRQVVVRQSPAPGTKLARGEQVDLTTAPASSPVARTVVVVLDPGHQQKADMRTEPLGPGSHDLKERATAGAVGVVTGRGESEVALEVAMRVKTRLEAAGVRVVMTRTRNDVSLSNVERARIANRSHAALFVRIHADAAADPGLHGIQVLYPGGNAWVKPVSARSADAAGRVEHALTVATGAPDRGIAARSDLSGFNWCTAPSILVEAGALSSAVDDKLLASAPYQDKVASGIADGVLAFVGR